MALRLAVVVSQAPGLGGMPSTGQRASADRERLRRGLLGDVEVAEPPGQGGDQPGPLLVVGLRDRLPDVDGALPHSE